MTIGVDEYRLAFDTYLLRISFSQCVSDVVWSYHLHLLEVDIRVKRPISAYVVVVR